MNTKNYFLNHNELLITPINKINSIHIEPMYKKLLIVKYARYKGKK